VTDGNLNVARQVGEQIRRYISTNLQILHALAADIDSTGLSPDQQDRILKNYVLRFPEFRELTAFDAAGRWMATSRIGMPAEAIPGDEATELYGVRMSAVSVDNDRGHCARGGADRRRWKAGWWLKGIQHRRTLADDRPHPRHLRMMVVSPWQLLVRNGERSSVARGTSMASDPVVIALRSASPGTPEVRERPGPAGEPMLVVGVRVPDLDWMVLVEQPTREAFAVARRQERDLIAAISLALLIMLLAGLVWGRSLIEPIRALIVGTEAIADGHLEGRVRIRSKSELGRLGDAFNRMAGRLGELQEDVRRQERHAMFGRVAAGLVHDLSHPFKNIQNNCASSEDARRPGIPELFKAP
jgi:HAMP domain-containing protein